MAEINSDVWVQIFKDASTNENVILQGQNTTLADAIGLLHYALMAYEMQYKIQLEYNNLEEIKKVTDGLNKMVGQILQMTKTAEAALIQSAALVQNIRKEI